MHGWFEAQTAERNTNVGQAKCGMIDHDVATALGAVAAFADFAALEFSESLLASGDLYVLRFPQGENANRRGRKTPAILAMAVAHIERLTVRFDLDRSAIAFARMCHSHALFLAREHPQAKPIFSGM